MTAATQYAILSSCELSNMDQNYKGWYVVVVYSTTYLIMFAYQVDYLIAFKYLNSVMLIFHPKLVPYIRVLQWTIYVALYGFMLYFLQKVGRYIYYEGFSIAGMFMSFSKGNGWDLPLWLHSYFQIATILVII